MYSVIPEGLGRRNSISVRCVAPSTIREMASSSTIRKGVEHGPRVAVRTPLERESPVCLPVCDRAFERLHLNILPEVICNPYSIAITRRNLLMSRGVVPNRYVAAGSSAASIAE